MSTQTQNSGANPSAAQLPLYDFRKASQFGGKQFQTLSSIHNGLGRKLDETLGRLLQKQTGANFSSIEALSYGEFLAATSETTYLASVALRSLGRTVALEIEPSLVMVLLDLLLSGEGKASTQPRAITEIEERVLESVARLLCEQLESIWKPLLRTEISLDRRLQPPQFASLMPANERITVLCFELSIGEMKGALKVILPSTISNSLARGASRQWAPEQRPRDGKDSGRLRARLQKCKFAAELILPGLRVTLGELITLEQDQILMFDRQVSDPARLFVSGRPLYAAHPVASGTHRAAQVRQRLPLGQPTEGSSENGF